MAQDPVVEEAVAEEAPKKSKKKLIIIIVSAVLVLSGIGGGAAWYFMGHKSSEHKATKDGKEEKPEKEEAKEEEPPAEPAFVKLETFTLNLNPEEGEKYLQVDMTLNASDKEEADFLGVHMPQVRNRILLVLTSKKPSEISTAEGKKMLSQELADQLNQPYTAGGKPKKISGVFFTSFVIQ